MSNRWVAVLVALVFFGFAFLIMFQQEISYGAWFEIGDLHHETFAVAAATLGLGLLIGSAITQDKPNP